jgi:hypothetical protein
MLPVLQTLFINQIVSAERDEKNHPTAMANACRCRRRPGLVVKHG